MKKFSSVLFVLVAVVMLVGCGESRIVKKSKKELQQMKVQADKARGLYNDRQYDQAAAIFEQLAVECTINQPLYECELSSIYLHAGNTDKALSYMLRAHESIDSFFDESTEKKASSIWGNEHEKVYKGDPYERSSLYTLLSLTLLEKGNIDNALAATKTGLLADSDSQDINKRSDYGILYFLAAKCYQLRGELETSRDNLNAAFNAFIENSRYADKFSARIESEYNRCQAGYGLPSRRLMWLCSMASEQQLRIWCGLNDPNDELDYVDWLIEQSRRIDPLDFNALVVLWRGKCPYMTRAGEYGEVRIINQGWLDPNSSASVLIDGTDFDPENGLSNVNYQALTRGGRSMDELLAEQARLKSNVNDFGDAMIQNADTGNPYADLTLILVGLIVKGVSAAMQVEADIRSWQTLPHSFAVVPAKLAPGVHDGELVNWQNHFIPTFAGDFSFEIDPEKDLTVLHLREMAPEYKFSPPAKGDDLLFAALRLDKCDLNSDGEISSDERLVVNKLLAGQYDADGDGVVTDAEKSSLRSATMREFQDRMVVK